MEIAHLKVHNNKILMMRSNIIKTSVLVFGFTVGAFMNSFAQQENREEKKRPTAKELIKEMDANEDGKLALKEIKGPLKDDFKTIDVNKDGFLTLEELEKAPKPKRKEKKLKN